MFVEIHLIQNFAPSNLNRDDTGAPKDCEFGGFRRGRISSQCLKRATRLAFKDHQLLPGENLAIRTRRLVEDDLVPRLVNRGKSHDEARVVAEAMLSSVGIAMKNDNTQYLLFLGKGEIDRLETVCMDHWDQLLATTDGGAAGKKAKKGAIPKAVSDAVNNSLDGGKAADLALFGRMLADLPARNIDAASQVAHAISTHPVEAEFDYYTAVDDLQAALQASGVEDEQGSGAGMLGTIEFNSACYYRYANLDTDQLLKNLGGDEELARVTVRAFLQAAVAAIPTGKQNSMAAHNPPSLVLVVTREHGPQNLANAFVQPASPGKERDLVSQSISRLADYRARLGAMYGEREVRGAWHASTELSTGDGLGSRTAGVSEAIELAVSAVAFGAA